MPNTRAKRTGTLWIIPALALVASCGKDGGGGGGAGGTTNVARTDGGGGSRAGTGGAGGTNAGGGGSNSTGSGGTSAGSSGGPTGGSGLTPVTGGSGAGGAGGSGSSGDAGPAQNFNPPADKAVAKFCNGLVGENMMILEFGLEIGSPPTRLVAKSGECFPALNQPCTPIPVGPVSVQVVDMSDQSVLAMGNTTIMGGTQMVFYTDIDPMMQPFLGAQRLRPEVNCALIAAEPAGPPPDGGTPMPPPPPIRP